MPKLSNANLKPQLAPMCLFRFKKLFLFQVLAHVNSIHKYTWGAHKRFKEVFNTLWCASSSLLGVNTIPLTTYLANCSWSQDGGLVYIWSRMRFEWTVPLKTAGGRKRGITFLNTLDLGPATKESTFQCSGSLASEAQEIWPWQIPL